MISNLEKYKTDLEKLISSGKDLLYSIQFESIPKEFEEYFRKIKKEKYDEFVKELPSFKHDYQSWYSESLVLIKLLLPDRVSDFTRLYEKPKNRKAILHGNYVIEDYLQGLSVTRGLEKEKIVGPESAIPQFQQQLNILMAIKRRFESSLFDIKQLIQADLFDSELETAKELNKKGFIRGGGGIAGVVLEKHLSQVCNNHNIKITKQNPTISDLNDLLKKDKVYETPAWRKIQHLGDLRNLCDHDKKKEPKKEDVEELIEGVEKITKTIF